MMRTAAILTAIFIAVTAAVHFGYKHLERTLQQMSCVPQSASQRGTDIAEPVSPAASPPTPAEPSSAGGQDFQVIVRRDIFQAGGGAAAVQKPPEPEPVPEAVPTRLNLTLAGTVIGSPERARAIVVDNATGNRKQLLLRVGDGVQGAVIKSIDWNKITLEVNGALEVLEMPKPGENSFNRSSRSAPSAGFIPPPVQEQVENDRPGPPIRPRRRISLPEELEQAVNNAPALPELPELDMEQQPELPQLPIPDMEQPPREAELPPELIAPDEGAMPQLPEEELLPPMQ